MPAYSSRPAIERDGERHVGCRGRDAEFGEQGGEIGIAGLVVDDEAGVDGDAAAVRLDLDGVGMAADALVGFVERDVMALGQQPSGGHAGNAGTDDGDAEPISFRGTLSAQHAQTPIAFDAEHCRVTLTIHRLEATGLTAPSFMRTSHFSKFLLRGRETRPKPRP